MTITLLARFEMAFLLGFHIVFAACGIALPFMTAMAHYRWLRYRDEAARDLTKFWMKCLAIFFATGAVTGTVISFHLNMLFPRFMEIAGPVIGAPFAIEGVIFFLETIFLGLYLYGQDRLKPWWHWTCGLSIGLCALLSGVLIIMVNGWMNAPSGFTMEFGFPASISPFRAMFNAAAFNQIHHMLIACFASVGFGMAGLHAWRLLSHPASPAHRRAYAIALTIGVVASLVQPLSGDMSAKDVSKRQPEKLAAMEALYKTEQPASLLIGGIPDSETETVRAGIRIPYLLSLLAHGDPHAPVIGLDHFPLADRPPVAPVHFAFQAMVGIGTLLASLSLMAAFFAWKRREWLFHPRWLKTIALCFPLGMIALELGWVVTEVGRQPWVIYHVMRTSEGTAAMPGLGFPILLFLVLYAFVGTAVVWVYSRLFRSLN